MVAGSPRRSRSLWWREGGAGSSVWVQTHDPQLCLIVQCSEIITTMRAARFTGGGDPALIWGPVNLVFSVLQKKKSFSFLSFIAGFMIKWFQTVRPRCLGNRTFPSASQPRQNSTWSHLHCIQKCKWKHAAGVLMCHLCTLVFVGSRPASEALISRCLEHLRAEQLSQIRQQRRGQSSSHIIGGLCNLDGCKMLCRLPSCRGSLRLTWFICCGSLSVRLTWLSVCLDVTNEITGKIFWFRLNLCWWLPAILVY